MEPLPLPLPLQPAVTSAVTPDAGLPRTVGAVSFTIRQGAAVTTVVFGDADAVHPTEWLALVESPEPCGIVFSHDAGSARVESDARGGVTFSIEHADGAAAMTIAVPLAACRGALEHVAAQVALIRGPCKVRVFR
jgi:hypothetical protein